MKKKKIVVAYSGGLDTSVMLKWLSEKYNAEMIAVTGDLGQSRELDGIESKAIKTGASKIYKLDLKKEFVEDYIWKALKAGALYEGEYPMACAIGRPLLAKKLVEIAIQEDADFIAHGATGKGNDQVRFEVGIKTLAPQMKIMAPLRSWEFKTREQEIEYAVKNNIPVSVSKNSPYSIDANLFGTSIECGILENPEVEPPEDIYQITCSPNEAPDYADKVTIGFDKGIPISLSGQQIEGHEIITKLNQIGGRHGIGRIDIIENRIVGIKSREIYEAPAAAILHKAHNELEKLILDKETFRFKQDVSNKAANLIYDGLWFSPLFNSLTAFVDSTQQYITGEIKLNLYKGSISVSSRKSPYSLYSSKLATYSSGDSFDHKSAKGFMALYGLPYKTITEVRKNNNAVEYKNAVGQ